MSEIKLNPMTGDFKVMESDSLEGLGFDSKNLTFEFSFQQVDYQKKYKNKHKGLCDMVADGDGFTREEIHDLVLTANKAIWQQAKDG